MSDDMKPCPWCGTDPNVIHGNMRRYAACPNADGSGGPCSAAYYEEADWNDRPVEDALRARAEAAEADVARVAAERDEARAAAGAAAAIAQAAQAGAARMRAEAVEARDDAELERGRVAALEVCVATGNDAIAEAHAEVARLRADALVLVGVVYALDTPDWMEMGYVDVLVAAGLTRAEADAMRATFDHTLPRAEVVAAIRRALGGAR